MAEVFNRYENKYLLDAKTYMLFQDRLSSSMMLDKFNERHETYPITNLYSEVWFNTPELAPVQTMQQLQKFGIKADGIINFLSNEPPIRKRLYFSDTASDRRSALALRRFIMIQPTTT